jgi:hypothetical protein
MPGMAIKDKGVGVEVATAAGNPAGDCVEIKWRKSSYSGGSGIRTP